MDDDCVPGAEMRWIGSDPDPIDAVLDGDAGDDAEGEDLLDVATVVHDLRSTYLRAEPLDVRPELAELVGAQLGTVPDVAAGTVPTAIAPSGAPLGRRCRRKLNVMLSALGGLVGSLAGKVAVTTAVAAAGVGGLHTADLVDVPVLPDVDPAADPVEPAGPAGPADPDGAGDAAGGGSGGGAEAASADREAADAYAAAIQEWTDCVADAAAGQGDEETRTTGAFDPREDCGDQPVPADHGVTELPDRAADAAREALDDVPAGAAPSTAGGPAGPIAGTPGGTTPTTADAAPAGPPTDGTAPGAAAAGPPGDGAIPENPARPDTPTPSTTTPSGGAPGAAPGGRP